MTEVRTEIHEGYIHEIGHVTLATAKAYDEVGKYLGFYSVIMKQRRFPESDAAYCELAKAKLLDMLDREAAQ